MANVALVNPERALELYASGRSLDDVAGEFGVTRQAVHRVLARDPRYQPRTKSQAARRSVEDPVVLGLWNQGLSQRAIGRRLGVSHPTVSRSLRRSGIKLRNVDS
jgi:DNA-binding transcriptional regulator LsrR (DeoR family)